MKDVVSYRLQAAKKERIFDFSKKEPSEEAVYVLVCINFFVRLSD